VNDPRKTFESLWSFGAEFGVMVDRTKPGVTMPDFVAGNPVMFKMGSQSVPSVPIVSIDDESVVVSLKFTNAGRQSFEPVVIPWTAVVTFIANQSALENHVAKALERGAAVTRKFGIIDGGKKDLPS
jgi:prophage tail gpP-like protein